MDVDRIAEIADQLRHRVRDQYPEEYGAWLAQQCPDPQDWWRLVFVLAHAVPAGPGWLKLTAWTRPKAKPDHIDEIAVERACRGDKVTLTAAERRRAVEVLIRRGLSYQAAADRLHMHPRTVSRLYSKTKESA